MTDFCERCEVNPQWEGSDDAFKNTEPFCGDCRRWFDRVCVIERKMIELLDKLDDEGRVTEDEVVEASEQALFELDQLPVTARVSHE